jgi:cytochrome b subunit of formate dehydrogenase
MTGSVYNPVRTTAAMQIFICALAFFGQCFLYTPVYAEEPASEPERLMTAQSGDCAACHGTQQMLPTGHLNTRGLTLGECRMCHQDEEVPMTNRLPLSHAHQLSGIACSDCHGDQDPPQSVEKDQCITCHDEQELIRRTEYLRELEANPHDSPHYGTDLDCNMCHYEHSESELFCSQCHDFDFVVNSPVLGSEMKAKISSEMNNRCEMCHNDSDYNAHFLDASHGILECTTCHTGIDDIVQHMKKADTPELQSCAVCHKEIDERFQKDAHFVKENMTCQDCHTNVHTATKPDMETFKKDVVETCTQCHDQGMYAYLGHGGDVLVGNNDSATCTDCHTLHQTPLYSSDDEKDIAAIRLMQTKMCTTCHDDPEITGRNGLALAAVANFDKTYHGKVLGIGFPEMTAGCADCHNGHSTLAGTDPRSPLHPDNRPAICGQCHDDFHPRFASYIAHPDYTDRERFPLLFWTNIFMEGLLFSVFGFFWIHSILWWRKAYWKKWTGAGTPDSGSHPNFEQFPDPPASADHELIDDPQTPAEPGVLQESPPAENLPSVVCKPQQYVRRFTLRDRIMHIALIVAFFTLVMTGFPLKYHETAWAKVMINFWGGVTGAGICHRIAALVLIAMFLYTCCLSVKYLFPKGQGAKGWLGRLFGPDSLCPNLKDLNDIRGMFRWFLGRGEMPQFDRWTYWEKFDFFAVFWGMFVIGLSGLMLWFPELFSYILPGWVINIAAVTHSEEALLAAVFIFTVHFFNNHLVPNKFPLEDNIFTGRYTVEALKEERPLEYERIMAEDRIETIKAKEPGVLTRLFSSVFGIACVLLGLLLTTLIMWAIFFY